MRLKDQCWRKNDQPGIDAWVWEQDGFKFVMGPSWYWMPDVFENFFCIVSLKSQAVFYELKTRRIQGLLWQGWYIGRTLLLCNALEDLFNSIEPGRQRGLKFFFGSRPRINYRVGMGEVSIVSLHNITEFIDRNLIGRATGMQFNSCSMSSHVHKML